MTVLQIPLDFSFFSQRLYFRVLSAVSKFITPDPIECVDRHSLFNKAIDECSDLVNSICFSFCTKLTDFEDLKQEAWLNIWKGINKYHGECKLSTWIYRVTFNSCISTLRSPTFKKYKYEDISEIADRIAESPSQRDDIEYLHYLISCLSAEDKAVIVMWLDEQPYEEIAYVTGLSRSNIAIRIHRIKEKLNKLHNRIK